MRQLTHLSLFSGIGGLDSAAEWAGFETVGQCEFADYPTKVLEKHWADVPRWRDIRTLNKESFYEKTGLRTVDVISGGFPCQPFSVAGKRRGKEDDRYLWGEMFRVIQDIKPSWVVGENVANIVNMALDDVLSDLENAGYKTRAFIIPACAVDAPHRRDRCAIVGFYANGERCPKFNPPAVSDETEIISKSDYAAENVPNTDSGRRYRKFGRKYDKQSANNSGWTAQSRLGGMADGFSHWLDEPLNVPRTITGMKNRADRLKCLGNAVVPQQFYPIFQTIADTEQGEYYDKNSLLL